LASAATRQLTPPLRPISSHPAVSAFFLSLTGAFFVINLVLGVLFDGFARQTQAIADQQARDALRNLAAIDVDGNGQLSAVELKDGHAPFQSVSLSTIDEAMRVLQPDHRDGGEMVISVAGWQKLQRVLHAVIKEEREKRIADGTEMLKTMVPWPRKALLPFLAPIVEHKRFTDFMLLVILLNTMALAQDKYPQDQGVECTLEQASFVCTVIFIIEMLLNMGGLGLERYFSDNFMTFDFVVVMLSLLELVASTPKFLLGQCYLEMDNEEGSGGASALRCFRMLRLLKMFKSFPTLQNVIFIMLDLLPAGAHTHLPLHVKCLLSPVCTDVCPLHPRKQPVFFVDILFPARL
jgi:hypothetical protein